jgi:valyl-tRNA synthetase
MNTEGKDCGQHSKEMTFSMADRWINAMLQQSISDIRRHMDQYRFDLAAQAMYEFTWNAYCDWYVELAKAILTTEQSEESQRATRYTLVNVLETLLRIMHPFMPFITETIWQQVSALTTASTTMNTLMRQIYPQVEANKIDEVVLQDMAWVQSIIVNIRNIRGEMNINPGKPLPLLIRNASDEEIKRFHRAELFIKTLAKLASVQWLKSNDTLPPAATALVGEMELLIPLAGLIDTAAETARLTKEVNKLQIEINKCEAKLCNPGFVDKAPAAVVEQEKQRLAEFKSAIKQFQEQLHTLKAC